MSAGYLAKAVYIYPLTCRPFVSTMAVRQKQGTGKNPNQDFAKAGALSAEPELNEQRSGQCHG